MVGSDEESGVTVATRILGCWPELTARLTIALVQTPGVVEYYGMA